MAVNHSKLNHRTLGAGAQSADYLMSNLSSPAFTQAGATGQSAVLRQRERMILNVPTQSTAARPERPDYRVLDSRHHVALANLARVPMQVSSAPLLSVRWSPRVHRPVIKPQIWISGWADSPLHFE